MIIIGIDPGAHGAVTVLNTYNIKGVVSLPLAKNSLADIYLYLSEVRGGEVYHRANHISHLSNLNAIRPSRIQPLAPDKSHDNTMEIYLEEPGQIVVRPKEKGSMGGLLSGMTASRKLGRQVGQWEGIAVALNAPVVLVPPKVWQAKVNCRTKGDKNISKSAAKKCFNFLTDRQGRSTITHDIADSLMIALYGYMRYADQKYVPLAIKQHLERG